MFLADSASGSPTWAHVRPEAEHQRHREEAAEGEGVRRNALAEIRFC